MLPIEQVSADTQRGTGRLSLRENRSEPMMQLAAIRLLIVDDNEVLRAVLRGALRMFSDITLVGEAASGTEAVEQCAALQSDVILMDMRMPGMSGVDATRLIRGRYPSIKVIALTSYDDLTLEQEMNELGASYLLKSISIFQLVAAIRAVHTGQDL